MVRVVRESRGLEMLSVDNHWQVRFKVGQMGSAWQEEAMLLLVAKHVLLAGDRYGPTLLGVNCSAAAPDMASRGDDRADTVYRFRAFSYFKSLKYGNLGVGNFGERNSSWRPSVPTRLRGWKFGGFRGGVRKIPDDQSAATSPAVVRVCL